MAKESRQVEIVPSLPVDSVEKVGYDFTLIPYDRFVELLTPAKLDEPQQGQELLELEQLRGCLVDMHYNPDLAAEVLVMIEDVLGKAELRIDLNQKRIYALDEGSIAVINTIVEKIGLGKDPDIIEAEFSVTGEKLDRPSATYLREKVKQYLKRVGGFYEKERKPDLLN